MRRDFDLLRKILFQVEETGSEYGATVEVEGASSHEVAYHLLLLKDAQFVKGADVTSHDGIAFIPTTLSWQGHDFLDAVRSDVVWQRVMAELKAKATGSAPLEVILQLAVKCTVEDLQLNTEWWK
jgi:hypothetical protein